VSISIDIDTIVAGNGWEKVVYSGIAREELPLMLPLGIKAVVDVNLTLGEQETGVNRDLPDP